MMIACQVIAPAYSVADMQADLTLTLQISRLLLAYRRRSRRGRQKIYTRATKKGRLIRNSVLGVNVAH